VCGCRRTRGPGRRRAASLRSERSGTSGPGRVVRSRGAADALGRAATALTESSAGLTRFST